MKHLKRTFEKAKLHYTIQNQGNVRSAKKHFSLTIDGKRTYFTVAVTNSLLAPLSETFGYTPYDINHTVYVLKWESRMMYSGVQLSEEETAKILEQCDTSELERAVKFSDSDLYMATHARKNAIQVFHRDFYGVNAL